MPNLYQVTGEVNFVDSAKEKFCWGEQDHGTLRFFLEHPNNDGARSITWQVDPGNLTQITPYVGGVNVYPRVANKQVADMRRPPVGSYVIGARRTTQGDVEERGWDWWVLGRVVAHNNNSRLPLIVRAINPDGSEDDTNITVRCWYPVPDNYITGEPDAPALRLPNEAKPEEATAEPDTDDLAEFKQRVYEVAMQYGRENGHEAQIARALDELGVTGPDEPEAYGFDVVLRYRVRAQRADNRPMDPRAPDEYIYSTLGVRHRDHNLRMDERWADAEFEYVEHHVENVEPI